MEQWSFKIPSPPPPDKGRTGVIAAGVLGLAGIAYLIWRMAGWFGVGVLGLLVLFLSVRIELEGNRPVGSQTTPDLYATQYRAEDLQLRPDRTASRSERLTVISGARVAQLMGAILVVIGFGLFAITP